MKKNKGMAYAVLGIAFVMFNVIAFAIPTTKNATFWVAYVFSSIAFASQIAIWKFAFKGTDALKSKFLGIPLISVGIRYLIVQIIAFVIFMVFPIIPSWVAVEEKAEKKVFYIKSLQVDIEMLASAERDADTKTALTKLAEKIRFSDPISNEVLANLEAEISAKVNELKTAENKTEIITVLDSLITERNKKSKLLK